MFHYKKPRSLLIALTVLLLSTFLSSCAFKDIDKRTFVVAIGIDPVEEGSSKFKVTLKIALPINSIKDATWSSYAYMSHESDTMSDAIRIMESHHDKVLELGHTRLIVINEKLLESNLQEFMDYFIRRGDIQLIAWVAAAKPTAEHILKVEPKTESVASLALFNFFDQNGTDSPFIVTTFLFEFRRDFFTKGVDAVIPLIESNELDSELVINKSIIAKDKHKPLEYNYIETLYYNSLSNGAIGYSYKANIEDFSVLIYVSKFNFKYKLITDNGVPPRADIKINIVANVIESTKPLSIYKLDEYNKLIAKDLKGVVLNVLTVAQEKDLDPIGFGLRYRATRFNDKNTFAKWESMYPELQFNIDFKVDIESIGAIQ